MPHRVALVLQQEPYDLLTLWEQMYRTMRADFQEEVWQSAATLVRSRLRDDPQLTTTVDDPACGSILRQLPIDFLVFSNLTALMAYINGKDYPKIDAVVVDIGVVFEGVGSTTATADSVSRVMDVTKAKIGIKPRPVIGVSTLFLEKLRLSGCDPVCKMTELPATVAKVLEPYKYAPS